MPKINVILLIGLAVIFSSTSFAEEITLTTYYPAPYGVYREMRAQRMAIGDNYYDGAINVWGDEISDDADLIVEGDVGIGTMTPNGNLEVRAGAGSEPVILFSDEGVAHGVTSLVPTDVVGRFSTGFADGGGLAIQGYSEGLAIGLGIAGILGTTDPDDDRPAVGIFASKEAAGGTTAALADDETVLSIYNGASRKMSVKGSGNVGIGTIYPGNKLDVDGAVVIGDTYAGTTTAPTNGLLVEGDVRFNSAIARQGSTVTGDAPATHVNLGTNSTTGWASGTGAAGGATVGGGNNNKAILDYTTVAGGSGNKADNSWSTVGGGKSNAANDYYSFVGGGDGNSATGECSSILGGNNNQTTADYSTVAGGIANKANGKASFAAGALATAQHEGSFVWADYSESVEYTSNGNNTFNIFASKGVYFDSTIKWWDVAEFMNVLEEEEIQEAEMVSLTGKDLLGRTKTAYDDNLVGVISSGRTTSLHLGTTASPEEGIERLPVALVGRCFVKVTDESGTIEVGDPITSSAIAGVGMKATRSGKIIGYAMEAIDFNDSVEDEILVFVNVGYYVPENEYKDLFNMVKKQQQEIDELKEIIRE